MRGVTKVLLKEKKKGQNTNRRHLILTSSSKTHHWTQHNSGSRPSSEPSISHQINMAKSKDHLLGWTHIKKIHPPEDAKNAKGALMCGNRNKVVYVNVRGRMNICTLSQRNDLFVFVCPHVFLEDKAGQRGGGLISCQIIQLSETVGHHLSQQELIRTGNIYFYLLFFNQTWAFKKQDLRGGVTWAAADVSLI